MLSAASQLEAAIRQDPRYKAGVTGQVLQALEPFRLPHIRRMCDVSTAESFDPVELLRSSGTVWMLGSESHQRQAAGVCTALTAAIVEVARELGRDEGRLRPPLLLALDEAVNVAPIPRLEQLLSTGGGSGIQTIVVLQSLAAARNTWGKELGDALLDFNNAKIVLGGLSDASDLRDLSDLLGVRDERVVQTSRSGRAGVFDAGDYSWSWRQVPGDAPRRDPRARLREARPRPADRPLRSRRPAAPGPHLQPHTPQAGEGGMSDDVPPRPVRPRPPSRRPANSSPSARCRTRGAPPSPSTAHRPRRRAAPSCSATPKRAGGPT